MAFASDAEVRERFWQSVSDRAIELPYCTACKTFFYYPRPFCPACWSEEIEFRPASGKGTIWTYTVVRFAHGSPSPWQARLPYVVALVSLDEGVRMMGNIVDCNVDHVRSGMPVRITYIEIDDRTLPAFVLE